MSEFKREVRYTVIKHSQLTEGQMQYLKNCIFGEGIPTVEAVVIEADWPEFEPVWSMIEDRVSGAPVEGGKAEYDALAEAMTTNQTIDGVPRELLERIADPYRREPRSIHLHNADIAELRALLDAPADPASALNRAWQAGYDTGYYAKNPAHERPAAQHQGEPVAILSGPDDSVCWTQDSKPRELRKQVVLIEHSDLLRLQALSSRAVEPVYQARWNRLGEWEEWKTVSQDQYQRSEGRLFERRIVYAEQPAPVAVARMCDCNQGRLPCRCKP